MKILSATATFALSLTLCVSAQSEQSSPATFFPSHAYLYVQADPAAAVAGVRGLKLAKLIEDPMLGKLFAQGVDSIPPQADPRELLEAYPFDRCIDGNVAVGIVGFSLTQRARQKTPAVTLRYPQSGMLGRNSLRGGANLRPEFMLAIKVSDEALFTQTLSVCLGDTLQDGDEVAPESRQVDGVDFLVWPIPGVGDIFSAFVDDHFLAGLTPAVVAEAINRHKNRTASLATRTDFRRFAIHRDGKSTAALLHLGVGSAAELFSGMIPESDRAEIREMGGFDIASLQLGMGFHDGGICEWMNLAFADNPSGVLLNLARLWPSTS